jgi:hypothetical protein
MRLGASDGVVITDDFDVDVNRTTPQLDECKNVLLHVIKQAVDDYENLKHSAKSEHIEIWESANQFLFDDDYFINWGDKEINLEQICDFIGLDVDWVRKRMKKRFGIELETDGVVNV